MKQRRCPNGDGWYEGPWCPTCGYAPRFNKSLRTAQLNNQLYGQVERQQSEEKFASAARKERYRH